MVSAPPPTKPSPDAALVPALPRPVAPPPPPHARRQANLHTLPQDLLYHIIIRLRDRGASLHALSRTTWRLNRLIHALRLKGLLALPVRLPVPRRDACPRGLEIERRSRSVTLRKSDAPGDAFLVFATDVAHTSSVFHFRIRRLEGHRLDVGLAPREAFRFGTVERASSWSFDCFGRLSLAGRRLTYGRQMRAGDVVSVVYDARAQSLSFLDNGVSMGAVPLCLPGGEGVRRDVPLLPFVYFPYCAGEAVEIVRERTRSVVDLRRLHASARRWRRPADLPWAGCVIVGTWEERIWYALRLDTARDSMHTLWHLVAQRHKMPRHKFELIYEGKRLEYSARTMEEAGVVLDKRTGTCSSDILLSVPHIVS